MSPSERISFQGTGTGFRLISLNRKAFTMASKNRVNLLGNLGRDPELRYTPAGKAVATVNLATSEVWKDRETGERREHTEWHRVVFFGPLAEIVGEYLAKGSTIDVEGKLRTRKRTDKDGVERYSTQILANELVMLGGKRKEGGTEEVRNLTAEAGDLLYGDSDIPF